MRRTSYLPVAIVFAFVVAVVFAMPAEAQVMRCQGGSNDGGSCTTDADCPGGCAANTNHPFCDASNPCPQICRGGTTPGAECPEGRCAGICIGGDNPGAACTIFGHDGECTGGGHCNAKCTLDRCKIGFCKTGGGQSVTDPRPVSDNLQDEGTDDASVACVVVESGSSN
jgi:hypothetical protein